MYRPIDLADPFNRPLPPRPVPDVPGLSFESGGLRRAFVAEQAGRSGLTAETADAMVLAVSEIATNSIRHGGGHGEIRAWADGRSLVCEVTDRGHITAPLVGRERPVPDAARGRPVGGQPALRPRPGLLLAARHRRSACTAP